MIYPKLQRKQNNLRLGSCHRKHYISGLHCIKGMYYTVRKKTCTNCLRSSRSRVSSLTAYWEATNPVNRDLWVPAAFIPHHVWNHIVESWWEALSALTLHIQFSNSIPWLELLKTLYSKFKQLFFCCKEDSESCSEGHFNREHIV